MGVGRYRGGIFKQIWILDLIPGFDSQFPISESIPVGIDSSWNRVYPVPEDHIEKIDFQDLIYAGVNWPNSELYREFVYKICYIGWSATNQLCFPDFGEWISGDFGFKI